MANTYAKLYLQTVFAVKYRNALLELPWRKKVHALMGLLINQSGGHAIIVNGVEDHVHCFFSMKPSTSVSEVMKVVKAKSSKFINDHQFTAGRFEWQRGFGAFSYSASHRDRVFHYIRNQERRHGRESFRCEYKALLASFEIEFREEFLFHEPV